MKLIVGIDPGLNTGIACINIESGAISTHTLRNASTGDVCDHILSHGEPIIVASDVKPAPRSVKKISAAFNARLFYSDFRISDKIKLTKNVNYSNIHERDALAAAISARKFFATTFEKVDVALQRKDLIHLGPAVKELLIKKEAGNIESAISRLMPNKEIAKKKRRIKIEVPKSDLKSELVFESKLNEKDREISEMRKDIAILRSKNRDKTIENLRKTIDELRSELNKKEEQLETMKRLLTEGFEIIVPFREGEDVKDKIILVEQKTSMINKSKPRVIISDEYFPSSAPIILRKNVEITKIGGILIVEKNKLEELIEKESFLQYLEKYKHRYEKEKA